MGQLSKRIDSGLTNVYMPFELDTYSSTYSIYRTYSSTNLCEETRRQRDDHSYVDNSCNYQGNFYQGKLKIISVYNNGGLLK